MNPIAYHNALSAVMQAQGEAISDYERRLAAANERADALEKTVEAMRAAADAAAAKPVESAPPVLPAAPPADAPEASAR